MTPGPDGEEIVFIETTIASYLVARPSRDLVLATHQRLTREWWEESRHRYHCVTSDEVIREASDGEATLASRRVALLSELPAIPVTPKVLEISDRLLSFGIMTANARDEAMHLAAAIIGGADFLLAWNPHLVNAHVIKRLKREAKAMGWSLPVVCTPLVLEGERLHTNPLLEEIWDTRRRLLFKRQKEKADAKGAPVP